MIFGLIKVMILYYYLKLNIDIIQMAETLSKQKPLLHQLIGLAEKPHKVSNSKNKNKSKFSSNLSVERQRESVPHPNNSKTKNIQIKHEMITKKSIASSSKKITIQDIRKRNTGKKQKYQDNHHEYYFGGRNNNQHYLANKNQGYKRTLKQYSKSSHSEKNNNLYSRDRYDMGNKQKKVKSQDKHSQNSKSSEHRELSHSTRKNKQNKTKQKNLDSKLKANKTKKRKLSEGTIKKNNQKTKKHIPSKIYAEEDLLHPVQSKCDAQLPSNANNTQNYPPIDLNKTRVDLKQDYMSHKEVVLGFQLERERIKYISMIGKIASSMNIKKQTHSLAISLFDRFIDQNTEKKDIKTVGISSIIMALKVQHAESVGNLVYQFCSPDQTNLQSTRYKSKPGDKNKKKDFFNILPESSLIKENFQNPENPMNTIQNPKFNLNRPKLPNILTVVLSHEQIFSEYDKIICKQDISDMEMQMIVKFNFRLNIKSIYYWADVMMKLWKQFLEEKNYLKATPNKNKKKNSKFNINFDELEIYLVNLCQVCELSGASLQFCRPFIVISLLYILVRIYIEFPLEIDKGFQFYRLNLFHSANTLFVDKKGINEMFGEFLECLGLDMGHLVGCCQHISQNFIHKIIKCIREYSFENSGELSAGQYRYHSELYRYFMGKTYQ